MLSGRNRSLFEIVRGFHLAEAATELETRASRASLADLYTVPTLVPTHLQHLTPVSAAPTAAVSMPHSGADAGKTTAMPGSGRRSGEAAYRELPGVFGAVPHPAEDPHTEVAPPAPGGSRIAHVRDDFRPGGPLAAHPVRERGTHRFSRARTRGRRRAATAG